jgi:hypothetical protein
MRRTGMPKDQVATLAYELGMNEVSYPNYGLSPFAERHGLTARIADIILKPHGTAVRAELRNNRGNSEVVPVDINLDPEKVFPPSLDDLLLSVQKMSVLSSLDKEDVAAFCTIEGIDLEQVTPVLEEYSKVTEAVSRVLTEGALKDFLTQEGDAAVWLANLSYALNTRRRP